MLYFVISSEFISVSDESVDVYDSFKDLMDALPKQVNDGYDYLTEAGLTEASLYDEGNWDKIVAFYYGMHDYWLVRK